MTAGGHLKRTEPLLIAIGDLHGHAIALDRILAALQARHGILGARGGLRSGVTLVTMGDHVDRGEHALQVLATLRQLSRGAGRVVSLLGNHELMALQSLDEAIAVARDSRAEDPILEYEVSTVHGANGGGAFLREFGARPRDALRSYVSRMSANGDVGHWMRRLEPVHLARFGGRAVLFTHGDLPLFLRDAGRLEGYLARVRRYLGASTLESGAAAKWRHADLTGTQSIFWDRSFFSLADETDEPAAICEAVGVDFIVTGHTPQSEITAYGRRIFRVDVGMTPEYGENEPQALVFSAGGVTALAAGGAEETLVPAAGGLSSAA
jgi:hypothetical protein